MFKTLRLQNFQSHVDTTFDFHENFNCITGTGNHGKTSAVRALNFLLFNQWDKSWVTYGAKACKITATLVSGIILVREKGIRLNRYTIHYVDGTKQIYNNFDKTGIPEEIVDALGVRPVEVVPKKYLKINLAAQGEGSIMKEIKRFDRAKLFGRLSGLEVFDHIGQELELDRRRSLASIRLKEEEKIKVDTDLIESTKAIQYRPKLDIVRGEVEIVQGQLERFNLLKRLALRMETWKSRHAELKQKLSQQPQIGEISVDGIQTSIDKLHKLQQLQLRIVNFKRRHSTLDTQLQQVGGQLAAAKAQYVNGLNQAQVCPTCYGPVTQDCIDKVLKQL